MKRNISPFKLGIFVLLALSIALGALVWVGAASLFQRTTLYAIYFDESVQGLQQGAPVNYRGVKVGQVSQIRLSPDDRLVQVIAEIEGDFTVGDHMVGELSKAGLTGQAYLALKRLESGKVPSIPPLPFKVKYPIIPSRAGDLARMEQAAKEILQKFREVDIGQLMQDLSRTAQDVRSALASGELAQTLENLNAASTDLRDILKGLSGPEGPQQWRAVLRDTTQSMESVRQSTEMLQSQLEALPPEALAELNRRMEGMVATGEKAMSSMETQLGQSFTLLDRSLREINRLVSQMEGLIRSLEREPGQILEQRPTPDPFAR